MKGPRAIGAAILVAIGALRAEPARAQAPTPKPGTFSISRFDPTPPGDHFESVKGGNIDGEELFRAGLTFDYARTPLVLQSTPSPIVAHQLVLHGGLSLALWERVLLSLELPIVLVNEGNQVVRPGAPPLLVGAPNEADIGDIVLGLRINLLSSRRGEARLAIGGDVWLPTGQPVDFTGDTGVRAMPHVSVGGALPHFNYASHVGVSIEPSHDFVDVHLGTELRFGVAAAFVSTSGAIQIGPELSASAPLTHGAEGTSSLGSAELLGTTRLRLGSLVVGAGFGPGLIRGIGTPSFRGLATIAFAPKGEKESDHDGIIDMFDACVHMPGAPNEDPELNGCPPDGDGDGVLDVVDACPDEPGVPSADPHRNGCPIPTDRDGDGIPDKVDACPDDRGPSSSDPKKNGCPSDRDGDGIPDADDACPDKPGVDDADPKKKGCPADKDGDGIADAVDACPELPGGPSADAARNGCPHDTDGDTIPDHLDACPRERGPAHIVQSKNGCPATLRFSAEEIVLFEPIAFAPASARLSKATEPTLRDIVGVMKDHLEVRRLVVEAPPGIELLRAQAIVRWLSEHGIAPKRLEARRLGSATAIRLRVVSTTPPAAHP